jgi:hypothetical protein
MRETRWRFRPHKAKTGLGRWPNKPEESTYNLVQNGIMPTLCEQLLTCDARLTL